MGNLWEARSALRWGSKLQGKFDTEDDARIFVERQIKNNGKGRITCVVGRAIHYTLYPDDDL
jgi:hypothetical protein